jgi:AhpD family alkylhydroperoxidase
MWIKLERWRPCEWQSTRNRQPAPSNAQRSSYEATPELREMRPWDVRGDGCARSVHLELRAGQDPLLALVQLRASQINGCAYCLDMHWKDLRSVGQPEQRLYSLDAWRECPYHTDRERAALAWTEARHVDHEGPGAGRRLRRGAPALQRTRAGRFDVRHCDDQCVESSLDCGTTNAGSVSTSQCRRDVRSGGLVRWKISIAKPLVGRQD